MIVDWLSETRRVDMHASESCRDHISVPWSTSTQPQTDILHRGNCRVVCRSWRHCNICVHCLFPCALICSMFRRQHTRPCNCHLGLGFSPQRFDGTAEHCRIHRDTTIFAIRLELSSYNLPKQCKHCCPYSYTKQEPAVP